MKIVAIFAQELYAFHYVDEADNELNRLMELWTDTSYLRGFAKHNNIPDIDKFIKQVLSDAEEVQDLLEDISQMREQFGRYFEPLKSSESDDRKLPRQKGKIYKNKLRIYALKIDENCFVITGGAIKMSQTMQEHPDTLNELKKLNVAKDFLIKNDVFDDLSFFELVNE